MKKFILIVTLLLGFTVALLTAPGQEVQAATEMVSLVPGNLPIEIKTGDILHFTRTTAAYNNITYTEYFRNDPTEGAVWGFSTTGTGHSVRYNGTSVRLEGGTWDNHAFIAAFEDAWLKWSFVGNVGTLEFKQDWPTPLVGLYSSTAPTTPKTAWGNSTNISVFTQLERTIVIPTYTFADDGNVLASDSPFDLSFTTETMDASYNLVTISIKPADGYSFVGNTAIRLVNIYNNEDIAEIGSLFGTFPDLLPTNRLYHLASNGVSKGSIILANYEGDTALVEGTFLTPALATDYYAFRVGLDIAVDEASYLASLSDGLAMVYLDAVDPAEEATVNYYIDDVIDSTVVVGQGDLLTAPTAPVKVGFVFIGWETVDELVWDFTNDVVTTEILNLYANFVAEGTVLHTISFVSSGGSAVSELLIEHGEIAVAPTAPIRLGYTFTGWYSDLDLTEVFSFADNEIDDDMTLYAKWTATGGGGTINPPASETGITTWQIVLYSVLGVLAVVALIIPDKKKKGWFKK